MHPRHANDTAPASGRRPAGNPSLAAAAVAILAAITLLAGCAADRLSREGRTLIKQGKYEEGLDKLRDAGKADPRDYSYRTGTIERTDRVVFDLVTEGNAALSTGNVEGAEAAFRRILSIVPNNLQAVSGLQAVQRAQRHQRMVTEALEADREGKVERALDLLLAVLSEEPSHRGARDARQELEARRFRQMLSEPRLKSRYTLPISLQFRDAGLKQVFDALSKSSGINFIFDKEVRPDTRITILVRDVLLENAIDLILEPNQLAGKVLNDNTLLIFPNNPAKVKEYQSMVIRSFYLEHADAKEVQNLVKTMLKTRDTYIDEKLNLLVIRDTPDVVRLAEQLVTVQDHAEPEVVLEVEVLEILRSRLTELGLVFPNQWQIGMNGALPGPGSIPLNLRSEAGVSNLLSNPRIRVRSREKARILIGNRIPVISSVVTPNANNPVVTDNIQYLDVGLKLEVEPLVRLSGSVSIKLNLEVSTLGDTVTTRNGSVAFRVGTRTANTVLQIRDGETQTLMGLIQDDEVERAQRLPGLGDIPVIGRLFSNTRNDGQKTEIVLTITPRIVRSVPRPTLDMAALWSGTDTNFRAQRPAINLPEAPAKPEAKPAAGAAAAPATAPAAASGAVQLSWRSPQVVRSRDEFVMGVEASTGTAMAGSSLQLRFDPALLQVVEVTEGDLLKRAQGQTKFSQQVDAAAGRIVVNIEREGGTGATGSGSLVNVRFRALGTGETEARVDLTAISPSMPGGKPLNVTASGPLTVRISGTPASTAGDTAASTAAGAATAPATRVR